MALQIRDIGTAAFPNGEKTEMEKIKLESHLMHPDGTEHLYVKNKTLKYLHDLKGRQGFLRDDTKSRTQKVDTSALTKMKNICPTATS